MTFTNGEMTFRSISTSSCAWLLEMSAPLSLSERDVLKIKIEISVRVQEELLLAQEGQIQVIFLPVSI